MTQKEPMDLFADFLITNAIPKEKAYAIASEIFTIVKRSQSNPLKDIFKCLGRNEITFTTEAKANEFLKHLSTFMNDTPRDINDGLTPNEMMKTRDYSIQLEEISETDLPKELELPSPEKIEKAEESFFAYTQLLPWHKNGDAKIAKLKSELIKYRNSLEKIPSENNSIEELYDQYLAGLYNKNWEFTIFFPEAKLSEDIYLCADIEGYEFILKSESVTRGLSNGHVYYLSLLVYLDSFFETWGPLLSYRSIDFDDFEFLANKIAPALYKKSGFSAVMKFNPVVFWASVAELSEQPHLSHNNEPYVFCGQKGYFKDNKIPEFSNRWKHEVSKKKHRWIYRANEDFFRHLYVYYNEKTNVVYLEANSKKDFYELKKKTKDFFVAKGDEECYSMHMAIFVQDFVKKEVALFSLERDFIEA